MSPAMVETSEVVVERNHRIPTADPNVSLSAVVHRPVTSERVPALVTVVPYRNDADAGWFAELAHTWLAARGYACILVDFRGTGSSDGTHRVPFSSDEADDAVAAIDWATGQAWCTGRIGMWGLSYGAVTTMRTASRYPDRLAAIIPMLGMLDPEQDFVHPMGARGNAASVAVWGSQALLKQLMPPLDDHESEDQQARWRARWNEDPWILDLFATQPGDEAWRSRAIDASRITVPALCVSGWRDVFCDPQIRAFQQMSGPKRLIAGPWMHNQPWAAPFEAVDFFPLVKRWWDHWLRDIDNGVLDEPPVATFVQGAHPSWRAITAWPPPEELQSLGTASMGMSEAGQILHPAEPADLGDQTVGALSGLWWGAVQGFGLPLDQDADDHRSVSYTSSALAADLTVMGRPRVELDWQEDQIPERLVVKITDVAPTGESRLVTQGVTTRLVDGHPHEVELWSTAYRIPAGHRIRLVIGDADFPRLWPATNPMSSMPVGAAMSLPTVDLDRLPVWPMTASPLGDTSDDPPANSPRWSITRDCISSAVEVMHGEEVRGPTPNGQHVLVAGHKLTSTTATDGNNARTHVECWAHARMHSGETYSIGVEAAVSGDSLEIVGRVHRDEALIVERQWELLPEEMKAANVVRSMQ